MTMTDLAVIGIGNPEARAVANDAHLDAGDGRWLSWVAWLDALSSDAVGAVDAADDADAADAADTDAADADGADGDAADGDADADAADAADTDAADAADAAAVAVGGADAADTHITRALAGALLGSTEMTPGLKLLQLQGRYWAVTRVGWVVHVRGDEWELHGAVTVVRTRQPRTLDSLANEGPLEDHRCSTPDVSPEEMHRLLIRRPRPANEAAWARYVGPRPEALR